MVLPITPMEACELVTAIVRLLREIHDAPKAFANLKQALERVETFQAILINQDLTQDQKQRLAGLWKHCHDSLEETKKVLDNYAKVSSHGVVALYYQSKWIVTRKSIRLTKDLDQRFQDFIATAQIILLERGSVLSSIDSPTGVNASEVAASAIGRA
ncbi:hypothetical protein MMC15_002799 [Xylographa vitiligo]|nr:hypothetical protein [Xylographa vitiligo]